VTPNIKIQQVILFLLRFIKRRIMAKNILFCLEHCPKCVQTKELLIGRNDVKVITFPHDISAWSESDLALAKNHDVYNDLQITAPILWIDGKKLLGYLRIRKWLQDNRE
jgi:glutaredoxin